MWCIKLLFSVIVFCHFITLDVSACAACIQLTEHTFDKLLSKFEVTLVKFDVSFPYGEKHEAFSAFAKSVTSSYDLLIAEVGVKDYGDRDNEKLAEKYKLSNSDFPALRLFIRGNIDPVVFPKTQNYTNEILRNFIKQNTNVHLTLKGCVPSLDTIARQFSKANAPKDALMLKAVDLAAALGDDLKSSGKMYLTIMQKQIEKGSSFVAHEIDRVKKLLEGKLTKEKKKELKTKVNILHSFLEEKKTNKNDEL